jgi:hypothetical protein
VASSRAISVPARERAANQPSATPIAIPTNSNRTSTIDSMPGGYDNPPEGIARVMEWVLVAVLLLVVVGALIYLTVGRRRAAANALADARAEAQRWYERLGGQLTNLPGGADQPPVVRQALADASERYNAAGSALASASTARQFALARETALEGLQYIRAARQALGFDPGRTCHRLRQGR